MNKVLKTATKAVILSAFKESTRLELKRTYKDGVTLGVLKGYINSKLVLETKTIELKWLDNIPEISCICEGIYDIEPTIWNKHNKKVLGIKNVPDRSHILIHPANYASGKHVQLLGCIAPVTGYADLDNDGIIDGTSSKDAFDKVMDKFGNINCNIIIYS